MKYDSKRLMKFATDLFEKAGMPTLEAEISARSLVEADMRGVGSHGLMRLRTYAKRITTGVVKAGVKPSVVRDKPASLLVDGKNGMGCVVALDVMQLCMKRAEETGACFAAVYNGNHFGIASLFTVAAAEAGFIGLALSNATASVVPYGGAVPKLGANPLSVAIPSGRRRPLVLDMATSVVAQGKIIQANKEGRTIPEGWAVDAQGQPTTDPAAALKGSMLPFGGPKGYAIGLIIQILCSALCGANSDPAIPSFWNNFEDPQNLGFFLGAIKIDGFATPEQYGGRIDALMDGIKACPPAPGVAEVLLPGELEFRNQDLAEKQGIELSDPIAGDLRALAGEYGVDGGVFG
jgi:LDH2 family malate/lactate/ureidoglycolate dehydrogenase